MNLYAETLVALENNCYTWNDISYIGSADIGITVDKFIEIAKQTNYDAGFGAQIIAEDLVIIMNDGSWYERGEYDGSEWWVYRSTPQRASIVNDVISVSSTDAGSVGWCTLKDIYDKTIEGESDDY